MSVTQQSPASRVATSSAMLPDGREVERIVLRGADGFEARIITYGAALQALMVPDAHGRPRRRRARP